MITVRRICKGCGLTFAQQWEAGSYLLNLCRDCMFKS